MPKASIGMLRLTTALLSLNPWLVRAQDLPTVPLPPPQTTGGKPLMQALQERKTLRDFKTEMLPPQLLSDLLWAGFGINRPENGHRTAPSAMNSQEIDIYVARAEGLYLYDAKALQLTPLIAGDIREKTGAQPFVKEAPLALIFVANFARMEKARPEQKDFYSAFDAGCISQNIYLYCASAGLATVVRELPDRPALAKAIRLQPEQKIILAQSVGYPK